MAERVISRFFSQIEIVIGVLKIFLRKKPDYSKLISRQKVYFRYYIAL